jgi:Regulator of ribonuclease activity B
MNPKDYPRARITCHPVNGSEVVVGWPEDTDGTALRKLEEGGFDFSKASLIDFYVHFRNWPPHPVAMALLFRDYPSLTVCETDGDQIYMEFQVYALVTYELVTNTQNHVTELMTPFHGVCSSWGILFTSVHPASSTNKVEVGQAGARQS